MAEGFSWGSSAPKLISSPTGVIVSPTISSNCSCTLPTYCLANNVITNGQGGFNLRNNRRACSSEQVNILLSFRTLSSFEKKKNLRTIGLPDESLLHLSYTNGETFNLIISTFSSIKVCCTNPCSGPCSSTQVSTAAPQTTNSPTDGCGLSSIISSTSLPYRLGCSRNALQGNISVNPKSTELYHSSNHRD